MRIRAALLAASALAFTSGAAIADPAADRFLRETVYQIMPDTPACEPFAGGRPIGLWGNASGVRDEREEVTADGQRLAVTGIYEDGSTATYFFFLNRERCQREVEAGLKVQETAAPAKPKGKPENEYVARLRSRVGSRITYRNADAYRVVNTFNIPCQAKDGRYLPLVNVLLSRLNEINREDAWLETVVDARGDETRISDRVVRKDGTTFPWNLSMDINRWGELRTHGTRIEALLNACYGSYGKIWEQ